MTHEESVIGAIRSTLPSVVSIVIGKDAAAVAKSIPDELWQEIRKEAKQGNGKRDLSREELVGHMPHTKDGQVRVGNGSGFFVSAGGLILTNKHVVTDAEAEYTVVTAAEDRYVAKVVARDPLNDVAILKIDGEGFMAAPLGDSNKVVVGQSVIALGNALGEFSNTASLGIVSGLSRFITAVSDDEGHAEHLRGLIQTDAAINPGNSGGPLINLAGEVIGINSAVVYGAANIGFAIPINRAKRDLEDIEKFGEIRRPFLGVRYVSVSPELQKLLNLPMDHGVLIKGEKIPGYHAVIPKSPAERAGIREGEIILAANGQPLNEGYTLEDLLESSLIGDRVEFDVWEKGLVTKKYVTLEQRK